MELMLCLHFRMAFNPGTVVPVDALADYFGADSLTTLNWKRRPVDLVGVDTPIVVPHESILGQYRANSCNIDPQSCPIAVLHRYGHIDEVLLRIRRNSWFHIERKFKEVTCVVPDSGQFQKPGIQNHFDLISKVLGYTMTAVDASAWIHLDEIIGKTNIIIVENFSVQIQGMLHQNFKRNCTLTDESIKRATEELHVTQPHYTMQQHIHDIIKDYKSGKHEDGTARAWIQSLLNMAQHVAHEVLQTGDAIGYCELGGKEVE